MIELTNKLKTLKNPSRKSARELLQDLKNKGYVCEIENIGEIRIKIHKENVPLSLR